MAQPTPIAPRYQLVRCTCGCGTISLWLLTGAGQPIASMPMTPGAAEYLRDALTETLDGAPDGRGPSERPAAGGLH
ncbi:hypothetical protein [Methylobacterium sp. ID0610]|uniref:hypothetical protein n=1 Tax=Methylobacterium carpenticola TaxID=3344827 RepID=UPI0036D13A11